MTDDIHDANTEPNAEGGNARLKVTLRINNVHTTQSCGSSGASTRARVSISSKRQTDDVRIAMQG
jgi:hypothetical protein